MQHFCNRLLQRATTSCMSQHNFKPPTNMGSSLYFAPSGQIHKPNFHFSLIYHYLILNLVPPLFSLKPYIPESLRP
jgi:hypothetical protein